VLQQQVPPLTNTKNIAEAVTEAQNLLSAHIMAYTTAV
jgi:hypothetical protein